MNLVFDLDGTLCFAGKPISPVLVTALRKAEEKGHSLFFASARSIRDMMPVIDASLHHHGMVGGNGSLGYQNHNFIFSKAFQPAILDPLKDLIEKYKATYMADGQWNYSYTGSEDHFLFPHIDSQKVAKNIPLDQLDPVVKILILTSRNNSLLQDELSHLPVFLTGHGEEDVIDINPQGIDKWHGLQDLGIKEKDFIVFGNDFNDIPMFQHADHSIMIGEHDQLSVFSSESIALTGDYESKIAQKILSLI